MKKFARNVYGTSRVMRSSDREICNLGHVLPIMLPSVIEVYGDINVFCSRNTSKGRSFPVVFCMHLLYLSLLCQKISLEQYAGTCCQKFAVAKSGKVEAFGTNCV